MFFYIDDIVVVFEKERRQYAEQLINLLKVKYKMTGGSDLQWFLGIEVIRDRKERIIQLSQASFIDKMAKLVVDSVFLPPTPMRNIELLLYDSKATLSSINQY